MFTRSILHAVLAYFLLVSFVAAQSTSTRRTTASPAPGVSSTSVRPTTPSSSARSSSAVSSRTSSSGSSVATATGGGVDTLPTGGAPPDVLLHIPQLSVGRIELDVEELKADINLNAKVAGLVSVNAGVAISVQKINITIADVEAQLDLVVRLGHLADIVSRVFESLDLNPLLISTIGNVTNLVGAVIGAVDGLLGSITQGGTVLNFLVDNLGNIVQEVTGTAGGAVSTIVGNYLQNMTDTGVTKAVGNGLTQKTFSYGPLNALVDIVFNTAGQVVQATVQKKTGGGSTPTSSAPVATSSSPAPTSTGT